MTSAATKFRKPGTYFGLCLLNLLAFAAFAWTPGVQGDYKCFYTSGKLAAHPNLVYSLESQVRLQGQQFGRFIPFFHPPQELLIFAPLAAFSFKTSFLLWRLLGVAFILVSGWLLARAVETTWLCAVGIISAMFPQAIVFAFGQDTLLLLLFVSWTYYLLKTNRDVAAGIVLTLALFKPQLPLAIAFAMLCHRRYRFSTAFAVSTSVFAAASVAYLGKSGIHGMLDCMRAGNNLLQIHLMPNLRGVLAALFGDHERTAAALSFLAVLAFALPWRRSDSLDFVFATSVCVASFAALHIFEYDLVLLALPVAIWSTSPPTKVDGALLTGLFSGPLYLILRHYHVAVLEIALTLSLCIACFQLQSNNGRYSVARLIESDAGLPSEPTK